MDKLLLVFVCLLMPMSSVLSAQGYSIRDNRIVIEAKDDWLHWTYPRDAMEVSEDGEIRPAYIRKDINACLDAPSFVHTRDAASPPGRGDEIRGGIRLAGSNREDASNIMDGDIHTYWEPDRKDSLSQWWVEIDLGRLVAATRIVMRFVPEEEGDPFLAFKVYTAKSVAAMNVAGGTALDWRVVGRVVDPNLERQREFVFDLSPERGGEGVGDDVQYVRVLVTGSLRDHGEEVSREEYEELPSELRGAVDHHKRLSSGEERYIPADAYEKLPPEQQGRIRYYRWEMPRLAELEVWALGDNILLGLRSRGGSISSWMDGKLTDRSPWPAVDGNYDTRYKPSNSLPSPPSPPGEEDLIVDLGATFWLDAVRFLGIKTYQLRGSADPPSSRTMMWETLSSETRANFAKFGWGAYRAEDQFLVRKIHVLELELHYWDRGIREIQAYGQGYVPEITLVSPVIEVGEDRTLKTMKWQEDTPEGTRIEIVTRTGDHLRKIEHYFDRDGKEISAEKYHKLPFFAQGPVVEEVVPGSGWSDWSSVYRSSGDLVSSPGPRNYLQIQAQLLSGDPEQLAALRSISVGLSLPLAERVFGELAPSRVPHGGEETFSLFIHPLFSPVSRGFDEIMIVPSVPMDLELVEVRVGREAEFSEGRAEVFPPDEVLVSSSAGDTLLLRLPEPVQPEGADLVEIRFRSSVFLSGIAFRVFVFNSSLPGVRQRVDAGDATYVVDTQALEVSMGIDPRIVRDAEIHPNPFTPNGDGINDRTEIRFGVYDVYGSDRVKVDIYDLSGRKIALFRERREQASGQWCFVWNGTDRWGRIVPPGTYVVRVCVDGGFEDVTHTTVTRLVHVVH